MRILVDSGPQHWLEILEGMLKIYNEDRYKKLFQRS